MSDQRTPTADALRTWAEAHRNEMMAFIREMALIESPTDVPGSQAPVQAMLGRALGEAGYAVRHIPGVRTGGVLLARPAERTRGKPLQLLVGHCDTVWPIGTLERMPVKEVDGRLRGPGVFDMKAGLALIVFALRALRELGLESPATPVVFINSDEETGSPESGRLIRRMGPRVCRAFVPEPSMGPGGLLKTARKGVGNFDVTITGQPAHAGLNPGGGASAISELAHVIQALHALNDLERGTSVNVGVVRGGTRPNVVAETAVAEVDVRVVSLEEGRRITEEILSLRSATQGVKVEVAGGMRIPPLERTPRNRRLWAQAREAAAALGISLGETMVGGASDGSVLSQYTATLDGVGAVGDGPHAHHEHLVIEPTVERCALLAMLLLAPVDAERDA